LGPSPQLRSGVLTVAGTLLVAIGIFIHSGWPFVIAGLALLVVAAGSR
jgi:hypothetical protein